MKIGSVGRIVSFSSRRLCARLHRYARLSPNHVWFREALRAGLGVRLFLSGRGKFPLAHFQLGATITVLQDPIVQLA
jgi:hypothetical protein